MKRTLFSLAGIAAVAFALTACDRVPRSDTIQSETQERILQEGTAQLGMPAIKNFREKRLLKMIYELRDQDGLVTFTYYM